MGNIYIHALVFHILVSYIVCMDDVRKKLINLRIYIWQLVNLNHIYIHAALFLNFQLVNICILARGLDPRLK